MPGKICYLGDDSLQGAAAYLGGIMLHYGLDFDYVPTAEAPPADFIKTPYSLYVVSDYYAAKFGQAAMSHVPRCVEQGAGLLMLGGWVSYHGQLGEYHASPLADVLPVVMEQHDDRRNAFQPCLMNKKEDHPIVDGLPWSMPPGIGGYNAITPKPGATMLLTSVRFSVRRAGKGTEQVAGKTPFALHNVSPTATSVPFGSEADDFHFTRGEESPLLVVGHYGRGRVAALATDVAPHWVGGLVDWGDRRITQEVAGGSIEVGNWYAQFFRNLLTWTGNI
jgi:uncharacterized membrane protein